MIVGDGKWLIVGHWGRKGDSIMPAVRIRQGLWKNLLAAAEKQPRKPETLANQALSDFLERIADRELLSRSAAAARRSPLGIADTEEAVRRYRRKK
jgi:hypothetical protein